MARKVKKYRNGGEIDNNGKALKGITVKGKYISDKEYRKALKAYNDSLIVHNLQKLGLDEYNKAKKMSYEDRLNYFNNIKYNINNPLWSAILDLEKLNNESPITKAYGPDETAIRSEGLYMNRPKQFPKPISKPNKPVNNPYIPRGHRMNSITYTAPKDRLNIKQKQSQFISITSNIKKAQLSKNRIYSGVSAFDDGKHSYSINEDNNISSLTEKGFSELMNSGFYDRSGKLLPQRKQGGNLPEYSLGSFLPGALKTLAGVALTATGAGAAIGVPLIVGGVADTVQGISNEAAIKQNTALQEDQLVTQQNAITNQNLLGTLNPGVLNRAFGGGLDILNTQQGKQLSELNGGDGSVDSIKLGNIAKVNSGEFKYKSYIFSNDIEYK